MTNLTYYLAITRARDNTVTNATLSIIDLTLDDGTRINSTMMGGRPWPRCVKAGGVFRTRTRPTLCSDEASRVRASV